MSITAAGAAGLAFVVALALVPLLVRFAIGRNLLDVPNARSSHEVPTPRLGGLAVIAGVWTGAWLLEGGWSVLIAATLAGVVGLLDDLMSLRFWMKALGQAAVAVVFLLIVPPPLVASASGLLELAAFALCVVWLVALVNAFNFMDGIDGIVGGTAILNVLFLIVLVGGTAGTLFPIFAAAVAGFLVWNLSPARIFLGDSGSHFIGFFLGAGALYASPGGFGPLPAFVLAALIFTPFLFDTAYTLLRRARAGKNIFAAHREHIYQQLTVDPAKHRQVSNLYYGLAGVSGLAVLLASTGTPAYLLGGGVLLVVCCATMVFLPRLLSSKTIHL